MAKRRILIFGLQRMMRQIIENAIHLQPDLEVVTLPETTSFGDTRALAESIASSDADAVITNRDDPALALALLRQRPRLMMFAVLNNGRQTLLYRLSPRREELGELSSSSLLAALRSAGDVWAQAQSIDADERGSRMWIDELESRRAKKEKGKEGKGATGCLR